MDEASRNRIRLWLRGERALGLTLVGPLPPPTASREAVGPSPAADGAPAAAAVAAPSPRPGSRTATASAPTVPAARAPAAALFGGAGSDDGGDAARSPNPVAPSPAQSPFTAPPLSTEQKREQLAAMDQNEVTGCTRCKLCQTRDKTVFGEGSPDAPIFFIGEGPGRNEDQTGRPFVGRAGDLLNKMIAGMGLRREDVFIANVVKCRAFLPGPPAKDRAPTPDEVAACTPYLQRQLEIVRPRVIVTLGLPAAKYMLQSTSTMGRLRGQWHQWHGVKLMPTYHPSYVLREYERGEQAKQAVRTAVWGDLQKVMAELGLAGRKGGGA